MNYEKITKINQNEIYSNSTFNFTIHEILHEKEFKTLKQSTFILLNNVKVYYQYPDQDQNPSQLQVLEFLKPITLDGNVVLKSDKVCRVLCFRTDQVSLSVSFQVETLVGSNHTTTNNNLNGNIDDNADHDDNHTSPNHDDSHTPADHDNDQNIIPEGHVTPATVNTFLLGKTTILHVLKGNSVNVVVSEAEVSESELGTVLKEKLDIGQTLILNKDDENTPTDMSITPQVHPLTTPESTVENDSVVLIIQITSSKTTSLMPPKPPARSGSIIVFDDQPMDWSLPFPKLLMRRDSGDFRDVNPNLTTEFYESAQHYRPPVFSDRTKLASQVPEPMIRDTLVIEEFPAGVISTVWINMVKQGLSEWLRIPVIVARGIEPGPVIGITAVVHGNELNGVPCIHRVISDIDVKTLKGSVVAVPCVNVPGYLRFSREFSDGKDLNRYFPGSPTGFSASVFNYNFFTKIIKKFNYLIDLHTASFGRVNSYYVRADMNDPVSAIFAKLQQPQAILHNSGQDGTLRSAAAAIGIKSITVEIGNPQQFQNRYVQWSYKGVMRILAYLKMFSLDLSTVTDGCPLTIVCSRGFWIYTRTGGVLEVYPAVNSVIRKGDLIARIKDIFGNVVDEVFSSHGGVSLLFWVGDLRSFGDGVEEDEGPCPRGDNPELIGDDTSEATSKVKGLGKVGDVGAELIMCVSKDLTVLALLTIALTTNR